MPISLDEFIRIAANMVAMKINIELCKEGFLFSPFE